MSGEAASKARANEWQKKYPPHCLPGFTRSFPHSKKKKPPATQAKPEPERPMCLLLSRWNYKNFFSSDAMKSCNSGRERWSGNSCPNSVDRRGTDKPWSEHQEGIKVEKNNREMNVWVNSGYRLCEKLELCKLRCTFLKTEYAVTMQSANWINNRDRNFCWLLLIVKIKQIRKTLLAG